MKNIMIRGGVWPSTHVELVTTYLNEFTKFIKAIDFLKLRQTIREHSANSDIYTNLQDTVVTADSSF
jgi:hypothetical protein